MFYCIRALSRIQRLPAFKVLIASVLISITTPMKADVALNGLAITSKSGFVIAERGPNHRVWNSMITQTNRGGRVSMRTNSFTELATGLNHWQNGRWVDASDVIELAADGSGAFATNSQHQVGFAANLNVAGAIDLRTPDGRRLQSSVLGLRYEDPTTGQNIAIANLRDSIGQLLPTLDQVLYTNSLADSNSSFYCDVEYTHTLNGFEQDIILRQQPPAPEQFGLNSGNVLLEVWTEFFNSPQPTISTNSRTYTTPDGRVQFLDDEKLDFGSMRMGRGNAFAADATNTARIAANGMVLTPVAKHWLNYQGRTFLVEEVPFSAVAAQLNTLPPSTSSKGASSESDGPQSFFRTLPSRERQAKTKSQLMRLAKVDTKKPGFLLDYNLINTSVTNFTFQSDTTYYVKGTVNLFDTTTIEGGTVIKMGSPNGITVEDNDVKWLTAPYRPAVFTCTNDNSVGAVLPGSTGIPNLADTTYLYCPQGGYVHDVRFCYGESAYSGGSNDVEVWNCQFLKCSHPITANSGTTNLGLHNVLIIMDTNLNYAGNAGDVYGPFGLSIYGSAIHVYGEQVTSDLQTNRMIGFFTSISAISNCPIAFTNSILLTPYLNPLYDDGSAVGVIVATNCTYFAAANPGTLFQQVGAAGYYLAANSPYRDAGTSNISPAALAFLAQKTTYPPVVFPSDYFLTNDLTLYPQARRDSGANPDYGYHYDPLDYAFGFLVVGTNVSIVANPGTAIGCFGSNAGDYGFVISTNGSFTCNGLAQNMNRVVEYSTVQEQSSTNWYRPDYGLVSYYWNDRGNITINCRFTDFSVMAQDANHFNSEDDGYPTPINLRDCELHGGLINSGSGELGLNLTNCLLERVNSLIVYEFTTDYGTPLYFQNNLVSGGFFQFYFAATNSVIQNNMFYNSGIGDYTGTPYVYGYNGFYNTSNTFLVLTNGTDKFLTSDPGYEVGALGGYYLPTNNTTLIQQGSTNANLLGLYQYCITTNQVKEATNIVSIGYHYVASDTSGVPVDTNGDGIPDYLEDANGNGLVDSGETNWQVAGDLGLNVIITRPKNNSIIP